MRKRLILFNLIMILLIVINLTLLSYQVYKQYHLDLRQKYTLELQKQLSNAFDLKIRSVEKTLEIITNHDKIKYWADIVTGPKSAATVAAESAVRDLFYEYEDVYPDYLNLLVASANGKDYISNDAYRLINDSFANEYWFVDALSGNADYSYQFYDSVRNLESWKGYDSHSYISMSRTIVRDGTPVAVLLIDISLSDLQEYYADLEADHGNFFFMMNDAGQVVLSPENPIVYRIKPEWFSHLSDGVVEAELSGGRYNIVYNRFEENDMFVVGVYDLAQERAIVGPILERSILMASVALIFATVWSVVATDRQLKPIRRLTGLMEEATAGDLSVRYHSERDDEITVLGKTFNQMLARIQELLDLVYEQEEQKREAELNVMQEQIKPHFLYNTLDMIAWMAREHKADDIVEAIEYLSDFFRNSLSQGKELIPLRDELDVVEKYLEILQMRYVDYFTYEIRCPEQVKDFLVPRLCLQPLVENCVYHSTKEADDRMALLTLSVAEIDGGIKITLEDDGKPMDDAMMRELNRRLAANDWEDWDGGFGVQNTGRRVMHNYGSGSGIFYSKNADGYTVVTMILKQQSDRKHNGSTADKSDISQDESQTDTGENHDH